MNQGCAQPSLVTWGKGPMSGPAPGWLHPRRAQRQRHHRLGVVSHLAGANQQRGRVGSYVVVDIVTARTRLRSGFKHRRPQHSLIHTGCPGLWPGRFTAAPCPECGYPTQEDLILCPRCGTELLTACPECHRGRSKPTGHTAPTAAPTWPEHNRSTSAPNRDKEVP